ncbi:MAG: hypothetical protein AWU57_469 [Marinobacter sp. T13-3]|nr:MAG: hypothetical protein AWU57_469 [Marinobacter sp. T13-3]
MTLNTLIKAITTRLMGADLHRIADAVQDLERLGVHGDPGENPTDVDSEVITKLDRAISEAITKLDRSISEATRPLNRYDHLCILDAINNAHASYNDTPLDRAARFAWFQKHRATYALSDLIEQGNEGARMLAENVVFDPELVTVYGYPTKDATTPDLFIEVTDEGFASLTIANCSETLSASDVDKLEQELFDWAWDEGYFED